MTKGVIDAYAETLAEYPLEAVRLACKRFADNEVPNRADTTYAPSGADLVSQVRLFRDAIAYRDGQKAEREKLIVYPIGELPPPPAVPLGPIEVDFGGGRIDMRDLTPAQKEMVLQSGGKMSVVSSDSVPLKIKRMRE